MKNNFLQLGLPNELTSGLLLNHSSLQYRGMIAVYLRNHLPGEYTMEILGLVELGKMSKTTGG